jgi:hypothetical protein
MCVMMYGSENVMEYCYYISEVNVNEAELTKSSLRVLKYTLSSNELR